MKLRGKAIVFPDGFIFDFGLAVMIHPVLRKSICSLMAFVLGFSTTASSYVLAADASSGLTNEANALGKELGRQAIKGAPTLNGTTLNFQAGGTKYSFDKGNLAPTDNGKNIRYKSTSEDFENQRGMFNDGDAMDKKGGEQKDALFADAETDQPTLEGEVYSVLMDMAKKDKVDLSGDVIWQKTGEIMADMENVLKDLVSCDADSALDVEYKYEHVPDYKECQQVVDRSVNCEIKHNYSAGIIEHSDGPFNIKSCGPGCTELWIGKVGDNYWGGSCAVYEQWTQVRVHNPEAIQSATFDYAKWDDYMMVYVGTPGNENLVWIGPFDWRSYPNYFPPETPGRCELSTSWQTTPSGPLRNCNAPSLCPYGGKLKPGSTTECSCNPKPDCNDMDICPFGGVVKKDGSQACECRPEPDCNQQCAYGGSPNRDGTQECRCLPNPNPKPGENAWENIKLPWTDVPPVEPPDPVEGEAPDYEQSPGVDVTQFFKSVKDGDTINFKIMVSVTGGGEGFGRVHIRYDPDKIVSNDLWKPKDCVDSASGIDDGFATGEIKCTEMPEMDSSGCAWINGAQVCERHLAEPPIKNVSRFCREVSVKTNYNFYKGDTGCWKVSTL